MKEAADAIASRISAPPFGASTWTCPDRRRGERFLAQPSSCGESARSATTASQARTGIATCSCCSPSGFPLLHSARPPQAGRPTLSSSGKRCAVRQQPRSHHPRQRGLDTPTVFLRGPSLHPHAHTPFWQQPDAVGPIPLGVAASDRCCGLNELFRRTAGMICDTAHESVTARSRHGSGSVFRLFVREAAMPRPRLCPVLAFCCWGWGEQGQWGLSARGAGDEQHDFDHRCFGRGQGPTSHTSRM